MRLWPTWLSNAIVYCATSLAPRKLKLLGLYVTTPVVGSTDTRLRRLNPAGMEAGPIAPITWADPVTKGTVTSVVNGSEMVTCGAIANDCALGSDDCVAKTSVTDISAWCWKNRRSCCTVEVVAVVVPDTLIGEAAAPSPQQARKS